MNRRAFLQALGLGGLALGAGAALKVGGDNAVAANKCRAGSKTVPHASAYQDDFAHVYPMAGAMAVVRRSDGTRLFIYPKDGGPHWDIPEDGELLGFTFILPPMKTGDTLQSTFRVLWT